MREKSPIEFGDLPSRPVQSNVGILYQLLPLLSPYKRQLFLSVISLILASVSTLGIGIALNDIIDATLNNASSISLMTSLLYLCLCVFVMAIASFGRTYTISWLGERLTTNLRQRLYSHLLTLEVGFFDMIRAGELLSRLTTDTTLIQIVIGTSAALALRNLMLLCGALGMMVVISIKLTLVSLIIVPVVLIPLLILGRKVKKSSRETQDEIANLSGYLEESLSSIRTCYAFNRERDEAMDFSKHTETSFQIAIRRLWLKSCLTVTVMLLVFVSVCGLLYVGIQDVMSDEITVGQLSSFLFYAIMVAGTIGSFSEIYADLQRAAGAAERLFEILRTPSKIKIPDKPRALPTIPRGIIAFHTVAFAYPHNPKQQILKGITFSISPGEKIAIVGPSGAGKSTILSLLLRFFDPQSGSIYVDGIDIKDTPVDDLRARFGIVPQDPMIFSGTLYDNLLYARSNASEMEVWQAAESAFLSDFIKTLPQGIHTPLGARGIRLSGGQKQRLAIARVILRNAPILLLDEATSALDAESEQAVQISLRTLMNTRTTLVVAHRLATVLTADRIIVLNNGIVEAVGTHAELISENGLYRRLATLQFTDSSTIGKQRHHHMSPVQRLNSHSA